MTLLRKNMSAGPNLIGTWYALFRFQRATPDFRGLDQNTEAAQCCQDASVPPTAPPASLRRFRPTRPALRPLFSLSSPATYVKRRLLDLPTADHRATHRDGCATTFAQ